MQALKRLPPYTGAYQPKAVSEEAYLSLLYQPGLTQPQRKIELRKRPPPKQDDAFAAPAFDDEAKGEEGEGNEKQGTLQQCTYPTKYHYLLRIEKYTHLSNPNLFSYNLLHLATNPSSNLLIHPLPVTHANLLIHPLPVTHANLLIHPLPVTHANLLIHPLPVTHANLLIHPLPVTHVINASLDGDGDNPPKKGGIGGWFSRLMGKKGKAPPADEEAPNEGNPALIHPTLTPMTYLDLVCSYPILHLACLILLFVLSCPTHLPFVLS